MMRSKVSRNFVLLAPPSCGEVSANKSANVGALIFIVTLFCSVLIMAYHPPFVQRFLEFHNLVNKYQSDKGAKGLTTWSQFIAMLFCQLTGADSLREISDGLYSSLGKLSHIGATAVCRSTLSYANSKQPYKLYEDFYYVLLEKFRHEIQARTPQAKSYLEPEVCHWSND